MRIHRVELLAGARAARGIAVVIDVFRACSLIAYALAGGARRIVPVASLTTARELKRRHPDWLLLGERNGIPPEDFDGGNSPAHLVQRELAGRTIIHTTSAGTQGLMAAAAAAQAVLAGAFV
ncbi:MAG: 2-phosphosulfolactate phosphatase, partial [Steroidobacteraceae bacterium]|nr:2-phosphosulfolactate phosphatase [Steroidobacteraceae bacterium]MDW8259712.1 2-phosphosulfolactate phosphatase [Gammaproteobacteria bacterium]